MRSKVREVKEGPECHGTHFGPNPKGDSHWNIFIRKSNEKNNVGAGLGTIYQESGKKCFHQSTLITF